MLVDALMGATEVAIVWVVPRLQRLGKVNYLRPNKSATTVQLVQSLPKAQQQAISKVLDSVLAAHQ